MLRRKLPRKTAKTSLLLERSYVSIYSQFSAVLTARLQLRDGRKADLEKHVEAVDITIREAAVALDSSDEEDEGEEKSWHGIQDNQEHLVDHEDGYIDEDRFTTVTVEAVEVSKDGLQTAAQNEANEGEGSEVKMSDEQLQRIATLHREAGSEKGKRVWTKEAPRVPRKRKKKFRYENKTERKATRYKERSGNKAKARARKE